MKRCIYYFQEYYNYSFNKIKQKFFINLNCFYFQVKSIVDLRKKIYITHEKLENELKRKREMEKKLADLRRDISRQKKLLSVRRNSTKVNLALKRPLHRLLSHH